MNSRSGKTEQIVNYESGLPDNEISSIYLDKSGGFWAVHPYGFSVISPGLPHRSFNHYQGLEGSLISVLSYQNQLFVGTTLGVYRLTERRKVKKTVVHRYHRRARRRPRQCVRCLSIARSASRRRT